MPLGQFLGPRQKYVYTMDSDVEVVLTLDATLGGLANTGLTVFDPATPGDAVNAPRRFKPRGVYWQGTATGFEKSRKFLVCGDPAATLYASQVSQAVTIDGVAGKTTGRRGEKLTF